MLHSGSLPASNSRSGGRRSVRQLEDFAGRRYKNAPPDVSSGVGKGGSGPIPKGAPAARLAPSSLETNLLSRGCVAAPRERWHNRFPAGTV